MQHLMDFLIRLFADINALPNRSDITDSNGLDSSTVESRDKSCRLFVLNIFDLIIQFRKLTLFGPDHPLASFGPALHFVDFGG